MTDTPTTPTPRAWVIVGTGPSHQLIVVGNMWGFEFTHQHQAASRVPALKAKYPTWKWVVAPLTARLDLVPDPAASAHARRRRG